MKVAVRPGARADILRLFRYLLVEQDKTRLLHGRRDIQAILEQEE